MQTERTMKLTFSRREVFAALKSYYANNLAVQGIPDVATSGATAPSMSASSDSLDIVWKQLARDV
jgi:hypothetical protein